MGRRRWIWALGALALVGAAAGAWLLTRELTSAPPELARPLFADPTRLYSRPLVLRLGDDPSRLGLEAHLQAAGWRRVAGGAPRPGEYRHSPKRWALGWRPFPEALLAGAAAGRGERVTLELDPEGRIAAIRGARSGRIEPLIIEPVRIGAILGSARVDREPVPLHRVPRLLVEAVLLVEDRRFFRHPGIDPRRIVGASLANLRAGRIVEGGSTITQQLVKNLFLSPERSFGRKAREALLAMRLERRHPKPEILEAYLNEIYLGQRGAVAIHGVGAAARHWFGRDVGELDPAECALLAGMIRGPSLYSPLRAPERARARRARVLERIAAAGLLREHALEQARAAPLPRPLGSALATSWFERRVRRELEASTGATSLETAGLRIVTSLDRRLQQAALHAVQEGLTAIEAEHAAELGAGGRAPLEAALVALDPHTGDVLAHIGGRHARHSPFDRVTRARRQPGSVFKPLVALAALSPDEEEAPIAQLDSPLLDAPLRVVRPEGTWRPRNYDGRFRGAVTLQEAIERSLNVPFARLGLRVGAERIVGVARALGVESPLEPVPALALGSSEVTLFEMTRAFAVLAAEGAATTPRFSQLVLDPRSGGAAAVPLERWQAADRHPVRLVTRALRGVTERGTARRLEALGVSEPVAGKTGTTSGFRDAWFVGYTPALAVGVWVGFDAGHSVGLSGSRAALPIFAAFLRETGPHDGIPFHPATDPDPEATAPR